MRILKGNNKKAILRPMGLCLFIILVSMVFLCPLLLMIDSSINTRGTTESAEIRLSNSGSTTLDHNDYYYEYKHVGYSIKWSFESSNSYVGITVLAMDQDQYNRYVLYGSSNYYILSDGSYQRDSGTFMVPHEEIWYILFINHSMAQTYLSYNITYEQVNPVYIIIAIIIVVIIVGAIVATVLIIAKTRKPKIFESQSTKPISQPTNLPQTHKYNIYRTIDDENRRIIVSTPPVLKQNWLFCPYCGQRTVLGANFCANCGRELDE